MWQCRLGPPSCYGQEIPILVEPPGSFGWPLHGDQMNGTVLTAEQLSTDGVVTQAEVDALERAAGILERGEPTDFHMARYPTCICSVAGFVRHGDPPLRSYNRQVAVLDAQVAVHGCKMALDRLPRNPKLAAAAIRHSLATGENGWPVPWPP